MSEIVFRDISKSFGTLKLFKRLSLTCPTKQYLCLVGPSGCGKTTMMRMIAGLSDPDSGDILIGSRRVNDLLPSRRDIGLAFQNYALYPHLDVAGNLAFPLRAPHRKSQFSAADIEQRVQATAKMLKIDALLHRSVNQLSGGQQQRVALGRSLICNPSVLLLDEPIAHLDARLRYETRAELKQLHQRVGTTTIHVTHDQQEALAIADLIAVIKDGEVQQVGPPMDLYRRPRSAFVASFIGDPPMSLMEASLTEDGGRPALEVGSTKLLLPEALGAAAARSPGREVLLGLRPAQVNLVEHGSPHSIAGTIYSHEQIGRLLELIISVGDSRLRYRTELVRKVSVGENVGVRLSIEGSLIFDRASGLALH